MTRKIERQSETTPSNTLDEYLWNQKLGVSSIPPIDPNQGQASPTSLPPDPSAAPIINFDSSIAPSDQFGSGISGEYQRIDTQTPNTTPASVPARSKAAAVSTLYGDVNPTPTIGDSGNNGSQANRNNSSENLPNGPDASPVDSPAAVGEEEGGAGLAADLGEAASLAAFASKHWVGSVLDPVYASNDNEGDYLFDNGIDDDEVLDAHNHGIDVEDYARTRNNGVSHDDAIYELAPSDPDLVYHDLYGRAKPKEASMNWNDRYAGKDKGKKDHYKYIKKRGDKFVIIQKGTGKVLSTHDSKEKAIAAFKAMEMHLHG